MPRKRRYPPEQEPPPPAGGLLELIQPDPIARLYAIDVPSTPASKYRIASYPKAITFERDSLGAVITYSPGAIRHEDVGGDVEGSIPRVNLLIQNITRESIAVLEAYDGLIGQKVRVVFVRVSEMPDGDPIVDEVYDIVESSATEDEVELVLGRASVTQRKFPDRRIGRTYCAHRYGGAACGYDTTRVGALQTCSKLIGGPNGCTEHGLDEEAASLPNQHPDRILLFRGIPRASGTGVN